MISWWWLDITIWDFCIAIMWVYKIIISTKLFSKFCQKYLYFFLNNLWVCKFKITFGHEIKAQRRPGRKQKMALLVYFVRVPLVKQSDWSKFLLAWMAQSKYDWKCTVSFIHFSCEEEEEKALVKTTRPSDNFPTNIFTHSHTSPTVKHWGFWVKAKFYIQLSLLYEGFYLLL